MTENNYDKLKDAICELVNLAEDATSREVFEMLDNAGADAIDCIDKLSGFEAIGTIEDFKALKEKSEQKKPNNIPMDDACIYYENHCPNCDSLLVVRYKCCPKCGQKIDWSE